MDQNIFFNYRSNVAPTDGCLLLSEPHLPDSNFDRTVIFLCKHDETGSFGFVLNRKSSALLSDLMEGTEHVELPVFVGGPVEQNTLHFLHQLDSIPNAEKINDQCFWGGDFDLLLGWLKEEVVAKDKVRFFLGYSGWGEGQLEDEIKANSWIVLKPKNLDFIFDDNTDNLWKEILEEMGGRFSLYSKYPVDPRLN
jgi:putative transcriptional regulator